MSEEVYDEFKAAVWMANKALDVAWADPDDDLRTVSRQFLRLVEQNASLKLELQKQKEQLEYCHKRMAEHVNEIQRLESLIKKSSEI